MGLNWRDFDLVDEDYVDLPSIRVGDFFMEDTFPDVYHVKKIRNSSKKENESGISGLIYEVDNITDGTSTWMAGKGLCLVRLKKKEIT